MNTIAKGAAAICPIFGTFFLDIVSEALQAAGCGSDLADQIIKLFAESDDALTCYNWLSNYVANVGTILGGTSNDSFIPFGAQSQDLAKLGGRSLYATTQFNDNHFSECTDPQIWGTGSPGMGQGYATVTPGGHLSNVLRALPPNTLMPRALSTADSNYTSFNGSTD